MEDAMENTIQLQAEKTLDHESVYLASLILQDVHETIRCVHILVAVILRYVEVGATITDGLISLSVPVALDGNRV